ncbi:hypothetical protein LTR40_010965, partial [Exophiala xenobiotica]
QKGRRQSVRGKARCRRPTVQAAAPDPSQRRAADERGRRHLPCQDARGRGHTGPGPSVQGSGRLLWWAPGSPDVHDDQGEHVREARPGQCQSHPRLATQDHRLEHRRRRRRWCWCRCRCRGSRGHHADQKYHAIAASPIEHDPRPDGHCAPCVDGQDARPRSRRGCQWPCDPKREEDDAERWSRNRQGRQRQRHQGV